MWFDAGSSRKVTRYFHGNVPAAAHFGVAGAGGLLNSSITKDTKD
jgi:hypothetical protein